MRIELHNRDYDRLSSDYIMLKDKYEVLSQRVRSMQSSIKNKNEALYKQKIKFEEQLAEKDLIIKELTNKLVHAEALLNHDSTNTGKPTSQTPYSKNKHIPNSRPKNTGKQKGGQPGHTKHQMEIPDGLDVTEVVEHGADDPNLQCPKCGSREYISTGEKITKTEVSVVVKVVRTEHVFWKYRCADCGTVFHSEIPPYLKENCQYGSDLKSLALSLVNTGNVPINKISSFFSGITNEVLTPSEGFISKLQRIYALKLESFKNDLLAILIQRHLIYWDDTVIFVNTARACLRFYGDESIAYYTAHEHKDMDSLLEDNVLTVLTAETKVMHDHNRVNYNKEFCFKNIECNIHLERDCQKNTDDTGHDWSTALIKLISKTMDERKVLIDKGVCAFDRNYENAFFEEVKACLAKGTEQYNTDFSNDKNRYGASFEKALITRIQEYSDNYFAWVKDFSIPTTNNLSERALRGVKSHLKISGQFESIDRAKDYAIFRTYLETCRRNKINEFKALSRLCNNNPYTVQEIFSSPPPKT